MMPSISVLGYAFNRAHLSFEGIIIMKKERYILGLDLGTGSVGWSCVAVDDNNQPKRIINLNSRIFEPAPSSMEDRRIARGMRRVLRRRRARGNNTKQLFINYRYLSRLHQEVWADSRSL